MGNRWKQAKILSSQPKKKGKYRNWINIKNDGEEPCCINWDLVQKWSRLEDPGHVVLLTREQEYSQEVVDAKQLELENLKNN